MAGHSEGIKVSKFCALRKDKCPCGNEYQLVCTEAVTKWSSYAFWQGRKVGVPKRPEAHHVLCIASVTEFLAIKESIKKIVEQTEWCINAKTNMLAMPLWGHTIKWYCNLAASGAFAASPAPPPFQNIPQHDYDHNSKKGYTYEVSQAMNNLAQSIEEQAEENHDAPGEDLKSRLNGLSEQFKTNLGTRGSTRSGGTHAAWGNAVEEAQSATGGTTSKWYMPFSMADDGNVEERTFPAPGIDSKLANKIQRLVAALGKWGT